MPHPDVEPGDPRDYTAYSIHGRGRMLSTPLLEHCELLARTASGYLEWWVGDFSAVAGWLSDDAPTGTLEWRVIAWRELGGVQRPELAEDCGGLECLHGRPLDEFAPLRNRDEWMRRQAESLVAPR
ncbi:hypothetical protein [Coralloluteibacterium thermophilus]|uniref:Uncharacterized protein n=1 Tax=Coralloluteibacterium thermophilum TaxID=2707049 RepID=A0ABV9NJH0_9GAMM